MGNSWFNRENEENKIHKRAILDEKKKTIINNIFLGLLVFGTFVGTVLTGGTILLIDGGITFFYIITQITIKVYDAIIEKYLKYIPNRKKIHFKEQIQKFYENVLNEVINDHDNNSLQSFINKFIDDENILEKTSNKFDEKREEIIQNSNESRSKFNILVLGPTGSGKSTIINKVLNKKLAKISYGDIGTLGFRNYTTSNSEYSFIDSQGLDYQESIETYTKILKNKIIDCNKHPHTFIDMIYYCTNNQTRFQPQEIALIQELEKIYDLQRVPLIIIHTQTNTEKSHLTFKEFIENKYGKKYSIIKISWFDDINNEDVLINEDLKNEIENLKKETQKKKKNILDSSYYCKFIANASKIIYKDYTDNIFITTIKGFFITSKEESIEDMFKKILNMYRFQNNGKSFNGEQKSYLEETKKIIVGNYNNNLNNFIKIVINYNAESDVYGEINEKKIDISEEEKEQKIERLYNKKLKNEFNSFKKDIDTMLFPCLVDILKTKIICYFNDRIVAHLQSKIEEFMGH